MKELVLTTEPPTEPGWYWAECAKTGDIAVVEVHDDVQPKDDDPISLGFHNGTYWVLIGDARISRWAGPIQLPAEPTDVEKS